MKIDLHTHTKRCKQGDSPKRNIDSNKLFLCCDECMSCWENEDDLTQQRKKFMEYSIKSKIANASEDDISNFHWEKYKLHKCSDTFI